MNQVNTGICKGKSKWCEETNVKVREREVGRGRDDEVRKGEKGIQKKAREKRRTNLRTGEKIFLQRLKLIPSDFTTSSRQTTHLIVY